MDETYDECYETSHYTDQCCDLCPHRFDCSGWENDEEDED